jgi:hypothetical protein
LKAHPEIGLLLADIDLRNEEKSIHLAASAKRLRSRPEMLITSGLAQKLREEAARKSVAEVDEAFILKTRIIQMVGTIFERRQNRVCQFLCASMKRIGRGPGLQVVNRVRSSWQ